jgi:uncharacterized SAM-binding protein YcdF (DUF218 family)
VVVDRIVRALESPLVVRDVFETLDAIVVLGAPLGPGDRITPALAERALAAAELYRAGGAPLIVASGGVTHGASRAESDAIADELRRVRVPEAAIVVERASKTTIENARFTRELLDKHKQHHGPERIRVWLVTQPFHGRRARRLFRRAGFDARVWHIDNSLEYRDRSRAMRWVVREYAAWLAMLARGR